MQNVQDLSPVSARVQSASADKKFEVMSPNSDIAKKIRTVCSSQPKESVCRVNKVNSDSDQSPLSPNASDSYFQATIVAEKYLMLDQVEGSSLYRCVDVNTHEELVCKVSHMSHRKALRFLMILKMFLNWPA